MATRALDLTPKRRRRLADFVAPLRVEPGSSVDLGEDFDPAFAGGLAREGVVEHGDQAGCRRRDPAEDAPAGEVGGRGRTEPGRGR